MVPWGGLSCCLSAAALYLLGRCSGRDAEVLKTVTRVNQLKELAQLLDLESKMIPIIVTISGRVGSETPINCQHSGLRGVIVEGTAEQHFLKHNDAGSWIQDSALMLSMCKEVPWYLDDETGRVYVVGARGAVGFALTVGSEVFEESGRSIVRGTLDYLQGLKKLGVKRIEQVLPTGSSLTVVGEGAIVDIKRITYANIVRELTDLACLNHPNNEFKCLSKHHVVEWESGKEGCTMHVSPDQLWPYTKAVKDDIGTIRIQKPQKGPFYVSPKSIDQLVSNLGKWARWYKYASFGLTIFGVFLITKHAIHYYLERRRRWELRRRVLAAAAKRAGSDNEDSTLKAENGTGTNQDCVMPDLCVICLEQEYNAVFIQPVTIRSIILLISLLLVLIVCIARWICKENEIMKE